MDDLKPCRYCGAGETRIEQRNLPPKMSGPGAIISVTILHFCKDARRTIKVVGSDKPHAVSIWNADHIPPGYALVRLEGAEERVARAIYTKTPFYWLKNTDAFEVVPFENIPLREELDGIAQAAIKALTEGE